MRGGPSACWTSVIVNFYRTGFGETTVGVHICKLMLMPFQSRRTTSSQIPSSPAGMPLQLSEARRQGGATRFQCCPFSNLGMSYLCSVRVLPSASSHYQIQKHLRTRRARHASIVDTLCSSDQFQIPLVLLGPIEWKPSRPVPLLLQQCLQLFSLKT